MKYQFGDQVSIVIMGKRKQATIVYAYPEIQSYQVSVEHGAGGLHIVKENDIDPETVEINVPNRMPSWY